MSKRNTRAAKARRRSERAANTEHVRHSGGRDLSRCLWPGCGARWTVEIERRDGWVAFLCPPHASQLLAETDQADIKSISGSIDGDDLDVLDAVGPFTP